MSRTIVFDSEGSDITPVCQMADAIILNDEDCNDCQFKIDECGEQRNSNTKKNSLLKPWVCSKCGKVLSPYTSSCKCM